VWSVRQLLPSEEQDPLIDYENKPGEEAILAIPNERARNPWVLSWQDAAGASTLFIRLFPSQ
jgi:hypothetical protein